jgi:hypothetical protein
MTTPSRGPDRPGGTGHRERAFAPDDGCLLRADDCMLTRLASSAVLRANAPTLEASMEMAGRLAASSCCLAGTIAIVGWSAVDA